MSKYESSQVTAPLLGLAIHLVFVPLVIRIDAAIITRTAHKTETVPAIPILLAIFGKNRSMTKILCI